MDVQSINGASPISAKTNKIAFGSNSKSSNANTIFNDKLKKVATDMESLYIDELFKGFRSLENPEDDIFGDSLASGFYEDMLFTEYSKLLSQSQGLGLKDMLVEKYQKKL